MRIIDTLPSRLLFKKQTIILRAKFLTSLCLIFFLIPSIALATDYYVSPAGSDINLGSASSPFKTITKGISKLKAGDVLFVRSGIYVERVFISQSGNDISPITIKSYPGDSPVIDGEGWLPEGDWSALVQIEGNYINISGFEVKNSNTDGTHLGGEGVVLVGHHNKVSNMNVHNIWSGGIIAQGDYSIVENCHVWQAARSNTANPGSAGWSTGISACRSPVDGITTNAILRGNTVYNNWGEGLSTFEAEGTIIEDNIVYDNWSINLYISDTRGALVQRNIIYNTPNNIVGQRRPFSLGDERADKPRSANNTVVNNLIFNADFWAFWSTAVPGSGLDNVLIANNTIVNGKLEIGNAVDDGTLNKSAIIRNNIFVNSNANPWEIKGALTNLTFSNNLWSISPQSGLVGPGDVIGDPLLVKSGSILAGELSADYFKLLSTSPAINKGAIISNVSDDFFRNFRDATPDIGAYEYIVPVSGITVAGAAGSNTITTNKGTLQLISSVLPDNASNKKVAWSLLNGTGQASISSSGLVTASGNGTVTARATATDGSGVYGILLITISNQAIPVTGIVLSGAGGAVTITSYNGTLQLSAAVSPSNATNKTVTWSIANATGQASISSSGLVTASGNGTVTASATATDGSGVYGTLIITISNQVIPVTGVVLSGVGGAVTITTYNGTLQLSAAVSPSNATNKTVTWSVTNGTGQATINSAGLVSAIGNGTVTARATATDGSGVYGTLFITITNQIVPDSLVLVNSVIENNSPAVLEVVYNITVANVIPATSAFSVIVNSTARNINTMTISGTKVLLTLASPIVNSDIVTVAYSKPSSNPLQASSGGQATSVGPLPVTNKVSPKSYVPRPVKIFPNPAHDFINIQIVEPTLIADYIRIIDFSGKVVFQDKLFKDFKEFQILISLLNGIYIVQIGIGDLILFTQKLIINN